MRCSSSAPSCCGAAPRSADEDEAAEEEAVASKATADVHGFRVVATSFGVLFLAEWGDLSQLLTAGLAARYEDPVSVFTGSWLALVTVAGSGGAARPDPAAVRPALDDPPGGRRRVPRARLHRGVRRGALALTG